jgi:hypothetical protein
MATTVEITAATPEAMQAGTTVTRVETKEETKAMRVVQLVVQAETMPMEAALPPLLLQPRATLAPETLDLATAATETPARTTMVARTTTPAPVLRPRLRHRPPHLVRLKVAVHRTQRAPTRAHKAVVVEAVALVDRAVTEEEVDTGTSSLQEVSDRSHLHLVHQRLITKQNSSPRQPST